MIRFMSAMLVVTIVVLGLGRQPLLAADDKDDKVDGKTVDEWLKVFKSSTDVKERVQAAEKLGAFKEKGAKAIPALSDALKNEKPQVSYYAADALVRIGNKAAPALVEALKDEKP